MEQQNPLEGNARNGDPLDANQDGVVDVNESVDAGPVHVEPTPEVQVPEGNPGSGRYCAYDKTYLSYMGGVHDTKSAARDAAKEAGATDFEIVEV